MELLTDMTSIWPDFAPEGLDPAGEMAWRIWR
jgi:hypothetical protein